MFLCEISGSLCAQMITCGNSSVLQANALGIRLKKERIYLKSFKLSYEQIYSKGQINPCSQPLDLFRFVHKQLKGELNHMQFFVLLWAFIKKHKTKRKKKMCRTWTKCLDQDIKRLFLVWLTITFRCSDFIPEGFYSSL